MTFGGSSLLAGMVEQLSVYPNVLRMTASSLHTRDSHVKEKSVNELIHLEARECSPREFLPM